MEISSLLRRATALTLLLLASVCAHAADLDTLTRWGTPEGTVRQQGEFCYAYDGQTRLARWTLESIAMVDLAGRATRVNAFAADDSIPPEFRAALAAYQGSGFDRGHLASAGNYTTNAAKDATFVLSNIAPQQKQLNRGPWAQLEAYCRKQVTPTNRVWIVTVPVFAPDGEHLRIHTIGETHVWVPTHFAKSILVSDSGLPPVRLQAWLAPNDEPDAEQQFSDWAVSVDTIERAAGLDLWGKVPDPLQAKLEVER